MSEANQRPNLAIDAREVAESLGVSNALPADERAVVVASAVRMLRACAAEIEYLRSVAGTVSAPRDLVKEVRERHS